MRILPTTYWTSPSMLTFRCPLFRGHAMCTGVDSCLDLFDSIQRIFVCFLFLYLSVLCLYFYFLFIFWLCIYLCFFLSQWVLMYSQCLNKLELELSLTHVSERIGILEQFWKTFFTLPSLSVSISHRLFTLLWKMTNSELYLDKNELSKSLGDK